jgi:hypothetical protein
MNILVAILRRLPALLLPLMLAACATLPPATVAEITAFDPLTFDPNVPRIALIAPDYLDAMPNEAKIAFHYWQKAAPQAVTTETFILRRAREVPTPQLNDAMKDGEMVAIFRIDPKDHDRVRRLQALYQAQKLEGAPKYGSKIDASVAACRLADLQAESIKGSVFIKLGVDRPYVPVMQDADIRDMLMAAGKSLNGAIKICPSARAKTS